MFQETHQACPCLWKALVLDPSFTQAISAQCNQIQDVIPKSESNCLQKPTKFTTSAQKWVKKKINKSVKTQFTTIKNASKLKIPTHKDSTFTMKTTINAAEVFHNPSPKKKVLNSLSFFRPTNKTQSAKCHQIFEKDASISLTKRRF